METKTINPADLFRSFTKEQRTVALAEWTLITDDLERQLKWAAEKDGVFAYDAESIIYRANPETKDILVEEGEIFLENVYIPEELTEYLAYSRWDGLADTPFDTFIKDAETLEEREEWTARAVLWRLTLWDTIDSVLRDFCETVEPVDSVTAGELRRDWFLS